MMKAWRFSELFYFQVTLFLPLNSFEDTQSFCFRFQLQENGLHGFSGLTRHSCWLPTSATAYRTNHHHHDSSGTDDNDDSLTSYDHDHHHDSKDNHHNW